MSEIVRIYNIIWFTPDIEDCEWNCDECDALLNEQDGFEYDCGTWQCTECGCYNDIDEDNIFLPEEEEYENYDEDMDDAYLKMEIESYLEEKYNCRVSDFDIERENYDDEEHIDEYGEYISVYDAALAWASRGKDEDYMFGYTEEELEDALDE